MLDYFIIISRTSIVKNMNVKVENVLYMYGSFLCNISVNENVIYYYIRYDRSVLFLRFLTYFNYKQYENISDS